MKAKDRERLCREVDAAAHEVVAALVQLGIPVDEEEVRDHLWNDLREALLAGKLQPKSGDES